MEDENASKYKDRPKNPKRGVQAASKHERMFEVQRPIKHFWSAKQHSKMAEFSLVGFWPSSLRVTIRHTIFDIFAKGCIQIQSLIVCTYFLEPSNHYK